MLNEHKLVHMNGRIYDPALGRFLSMDPVVQDPYNLQTFNRYSYVVNNPLRYTDPSGEIVPFLVLAAAAYGAVTGDWRPLFVTAGFMAGGAYAGNLWGAFSGALVGYQGHQAYQQGGIGGLVQFAAITVMTAAVSSGIGDMGPTGFGEFEQMARASLHGIVGGAVAEIQGGKFATGFAASFATHAAGGAIKGGLKGADKYTRSIAAGVVGGTISKATGGKFANAAVTSGFQWLFNAEGRHGAPSQGSVQELRDEVTSTLMLMDEATGGKYSFYSPEAVDLLVGTALQESGGLRWRDQLQGGPAKGLFQMEQDTYNDIWRYMSEVRPEFGEMMKTLFTPAGGRLSFNNIRNDDMYAAAMARVKYWGFGKGAIPRADALPPAAKSLSR